MAMPRWMHQLFPKPWSIFCQCWDDMFDFGTSPRFRFWNQKLGRRFDILMFCAHSEGPHRPAYGSRGGEARPRAEGGGALPHLLPITDQTAHEDRLQQRDRAAPGGSGHGRSILLPSFSFASRVAQLWLTALRFFLDLRHFVLVAVRAVPPPGGAGLAAGGGPERAGGSPGADGSGCGPDASAEGHNQRSAQVRNQKIPPHRA